MSAFWIGWVIFFVVLNWALATVLLIYATWVHIPTDTDGTTGHVWAHGAIREAVRRLPGWWTMGSIALLLFGIGYLVLYPGFGGSKSIFGWSSEEQVQHEVARNEIRRASLFEDVREMPIEQLSENPQVLAAGDVLYADNCAACHGGDGRGNQSLGAPDLFDDSWLYGGSTQAIKTSLLEGRSGVMPALGSGLGERGTRAVAAYVYELNGRDWPRKDLVTEGEKIYAQQCVACHGPGGKGKPAMGAPDLTDESWLYGGKLPDIATSVRAGRNGVMPAWDERLGSEEIRILTAWIVAGDPGQRQAP